MVTSLPFLMLQSYPNFCFYPNIHFYKGNKPSMSSLYRQLPVTAAEDPNSLIDTVWKINLPLRSPQPSWSGSMQLLHHGTHRGQSSVMFLPMTDLNPSDLSCIHSTLKFICTHAHDNNVTPIVTFDQPLFW